ncbi:MAG: alpha/beta fold hydrolase [Balneola sp.]|nr:MAG: alpha/beta fold hydrolase [Balneola sp.]
MNIRVRGISYHLNSQIKDNAPSLILLHGFLGSGLVFNPLKSHLDSDISVTTIDLLGHGSTEGAELHYRFSTKEQVADLSKLISEQLPSPVFLYGYSMGARLALQLALCRPDLIQGLILESGSFGIEKETERQARQALDASRADQIQGNFHGFLEKWKTMKIFDGNLQSESKRLLMNIQEKQNHYWMANSLLGFGSGTMPCIKDRLNELISPVQLIVGAHDVKFLRINQSMKKNISDCELAIIEDANHRVHLEQPKKCATIINQFITNHSPS